MCRAAKKERANTSVLFTRTKITPISASRISKTIEPISTKFTYFMLYIYTTFHTKFEINRASSSRDICSQKSSDFLRIFLLFFFFFAPNSRQFEVAQRRSSRTSIFFKFGTHIEHELSYNSSDFDGILSQFERAICNFRSIFFEICCHA